MDKSSNLGMLLLLATVVQLLYAQPYQVNKEKMPFCDSKMGIERYPVEVGRGVQDAPCTGLLTYNLNGKVRRVCSDPEEVNGASAKRVCFTLGLDMYRKPGENKGIRLYQCDIYVENGAPLPDSTEKIFNEATASTIIEKRCNMGVDVADHNCFDNCYFGNVDDPSASYSLPDATQEKLCDESREPFWGIVCTDVNECLNGVLFGCKGPFDGSCTQRKACGDNTTCTNVVGSYECACLKGFKEANGEEEDPYALDRGCVDVNECEEDVLTCGMTGQCQNTLGSYICLCPQGQSWSDDTKTCGGSMCGPSTFDPNAERPVFQGSPIELATYSCKSGFKAPGDSDSYTNLCVNGIWEDNGYCTDVDECKPSQCDDHAACTNLPGSFFCICTRGYDGNGRTCTEIDPCEDFEFCVNGDCTALDGKTECICDSDYEGAACDRPKISTALIMAIVAMVLVALLFLLIIFYICTRLATTSNPAQVGPQTELGDVYGKPFGGVPFRRGPFRPPHRPRIF